MCDNDTDSLSLLKTANMSQFHVRLTCNLFCMKTSYRAKVRESCSEKLSASPQTP